MIPEERENWKDKQRERGRICERRERQREGGNIEREQIQREWLL